MAQQLTRASTALLVAAAGALHLYLWFDYFHRVHVVGTLFLVNAAAGIAIGIVLLTVEGAIPVLGAGGYAVGTLGAFAASTRWGLFGYHERFWGSWQEAVGGVELAAVLLALVLLLRGLDINSTRRSTLAPDTDERSTMAVDELSDLVACTLTNTDLKTQRERWINLGTNFGLSREETDTGLRLTFADHPAVEQELRALVAVENDCCSWAAWTVERDNGALVMAARSKGEGVATLHGMFREAMR